MVEIAMTPWEMVRVDSLLPRVLAFGKKNTRFYGICI